MRELIESDQESEDIASQLTEATDTWTAVEDYLVNVDSSNTTGGRSWRTVLEEIWENVEEGTRHDMLKALDYHLDDMGVPEENRPDPSTRRTFVKAGKVNRMEL